MSCSKKTTQKYKERNSPPFSAPDCKGEKLKGKDGYYISKPDKNNIYKWIKIDSIEKPKHIYKTTKNGNDIFAVYDYKDKVDIYKLDYDKKLDNYIIGKKIKSFKYQKIFVGDNSLSLKNYVKKGQEKGNTILLEITDKKYIYIGEVIKEFNLIGDDSIKKYVSPVGNSYLPYPYIVGTNYSYLMLENKYIPNNLLDLKKCVYDQYYKDENIKVVAKSLKVKIIN